jgi:hypothetical protein
MDDIVKILVEHGVPVTRDAYVEFAYFGERNYSDLDGEERAAIDDLFGPDGRLVQ